MTIIGVKKFSVLFSSQITYLLTKNGNDYFNSSKCYNTIIIFNSKKYWNFFPYTIPYRLGPVL